MEVFVEDIPQDIEEEFSNCDDFDYIEMINLTDEEEDENYEEDNIPLNVSQPERLYGKNGLVWNTSSNPVTQPRVAEIVREKQGIPSRFAQDILNPIDVFQQLFTSDIVDIIVRSTNRKAADFFEKNPVSGCRPWKDTNSKELYAFFGLLIHAGACKSWDEELVDLWKTDNRPIYRATMPLKRFQQLLRFLRFDDFRTRQERLASDKIAAVRDIWDMFQSRLKDIYKPSTYLTVDEQLVTTRGRCSFRQYLPSKPGKYGIKIFWCCDATNSYPLKGEIYIGRQPNTDRAQKYAVTLVKRITEPWLRKGKYLSLLI